MVDPSDMLLPGLGGLTLGGVVVKLITGLGQRHLATLDETLKSLRVAVEELHKEVRHLRETDLAQGIHIGALQQEVKDLKERINGQSTFWREEFRRATGKS